MYNAYIIDYYFLDLKVQNSQIDNLNFSNFKGHQMNKYIVSAVLWVKHSFECQAQIGVEVDGEQKASIISELTVQVINVAGMYSNE